MSSVHSYIPSSLEIPSKQSKTKRTTTSDNSIKRLVRTCFEFQFKSLQHCFIKHYFITVHPWNQSMQRILM